MRNKPKISIITPSYNQGKYLERTINSVLSQDYRQLEYLVMDGASTDNTLGILKRHSDKLFFRSKRDKGQTQAINEGLRLSKGEIIGYLNSDDLLEKDALDKVADYFIGHQDSYWVCGKCRIIDENGQQISQFQTLYKNLWLKMGRCQQSLIILNYISQPAVFWRRKLIDEIGLFDESLDLAMDYDYWLRAMKRYPLGFIDDYLASFRSYLQSKTGKKQKESMKEADKIARRHGYEPYVFLHKIHDGLLTTFRNCY